MDATSLRGGGSSFSTLDGGEGGGGPTVESVLSARCDERTLWANDAPTLWRTDSGIGPLSSWTESSVTLTMWTSCAGDCLGKARAWTGLTRSPSRGGGLTLFTDDGCEEPRSGGEARIAEDET